MGTLRQELLGTWRLAVLEDLVDGRWTKTFGEAPKGYFSFDAAGRVSVQFRKDVPATPFSTGGPTPAEALAAVDSYLCYFGAFTVDEAASTFSTVVEGALNPALIGTTQVRPFAFRGEQLEVGDGVGYRRLFERAR